MDREVYSGIMSNYRRIRAITKGICASSGKRSKIEEEDREARK